MERLTGALWVLGIILAGILVVQNATVVSVRFLKWHMDLSLVVVLLGVFLLGFLCGFFLRAVRHRPR